MMRISRSNDLTRIGILLRVFPVLVLIGHTAMAYDESPYPEYPPTREELGLLGPVRRVESTSYNALPGESRQSSVGDHLIFVFDAAGRLVERITERRIGEPLLSSRSLYRYDTSGRLVWHERAMLTMRFDSATGTVHVDTSTMTHYSYTYNVDRKGRVIERNEWRAEDSLRPFSSTRFGYDEKERLVSSVKTKSAPGSKEEMRWEWRADGTVVLRHYQEYMKKLILMLQEVRDTTGRPMTRTHYRPGSRPDERRLLKIEDFQGGRLMVVRHAGGTGFPPERYEYVVDTHGNWTTRRRAGSVLGTGPMEQRKIMYEEN